MPSTPFADVVEAAGQLPDDDQRALIDLLQRRLADAGRRRLVAEVQEARAQFASGLCQPATPDEILDDVLS